MHHAIAATHTMHKYIHTCAPHLHALTSRRNISVVTQEEVCHLCGTTGKEAHPHHPSADEMWNPDPVLPTPCRATCPAPGWQQSEVRGEHTSASPHTLSWSVAFTLLEASPRISVSLRKSKRGRASIQRASSVARLSHRSPRADRMEPRRPQSPRPHQHPVKCWISATTSTGKRSGKVFQEAFGSLGAS